MNAEKTTGNHPGTLFDADEQCFKQKAEEFFQQLVKDNPGRDPHELQEIADELAAPYFFNNKGIERPH